MNKKIENLLKNFKPQFGNTNHIRALEIIEKMKKREALKKKKAQVTRSITKEIDDLNAELTQEEKNLEFLLR